MTRFAIIGAGGLGGPVSYALAGAGVAGISIYDHDVVELSNLQRQIQFRTQDIGKGKAAVLANELVRRGYPGERLDVKTQRIDPDNIAALLADADLLIDCSDNFQTKFTVNDHAVTHNVPCIIASVTRHHGQIIRIKPGFGGCYRCLFETPPDQLRTPSDAATDNCATAGIFGAAAAVIAGETARQAVKLATSSSSLGNGLFVFSDLRQTDIPRIVR